MLVRDSCSKQLDSDRLAADVPERQCEHEISSLVFARHPWISRNGKTWVNVWSNKYGLKIFGFTTTNICGG